MLKTLIIAFYSFTTLAYPQQDPRGGSIDDLGSALAVQCKTQPDLEVCRAYYAAEVVLAEISREYLECPEYRCYLLQGAIFPLGHRFDIRITSDLKFRLTREKTYLIYELQF